MECSICGYKVQCCGWPNDYQDVTEHDLVLQSDNYYECTTCGYRIASPALEDEDILSDEDQRGIKSLLHTASFLEGIRQGNPELFPQPLWRWKRYGLSLLLFLRKTYLYIVRIQI